MLTLCRQGGIAYGQCNDLDIVIDGVEAPLFCDTDSLECLTYGQEPTTFSSFPSFQFTEACGGTVENPNWFSFIAWTPLTDLTITYESCESSAISVEHGVQVFFFDAGENWDEEVTPFAFNCSCDTPYDPSGPNEFTVTSDSLEIGRQYYVMIDGCAGNVCDAVTLEFMDLPVNFELPQITRDSINNPFCTEQRVCSNTNIEISWPEHEEAGGLTYIISVYDPDGTPISSMVVDTSSFEWLTSVPGDYTYDVSFSNTCDADNDLFVGAITVDAPDTIIHATDTICLMDASNYIGWPSHWLINGCNPSIVPMQEEPYECSRIDDCNCLVVEQKSVHVFPLTTIPTVDTVVCTSDAFPFFFNGNFIETENPGGFTHLVNGGTEGFGCDSTIIIQVYAPEVEASLEIISCDGLDVTYEVTIDEMSDYLDPNLIQINWYEDGDVVETGDNFTTSIDSLVSAEVTWTFLTSMSGADCEEVIVTDTTYLASSSEDYEFPLVSCDFSNDTVFYNFSFVPAGNSLVDINILTPQFPSEWDGNTLIFPNIDANEEVSIMLSATDGNCSVPDSPPINCSTECTNYNITLTQDNPVPQCLQTGTIPISLEVNVTPSPSPAAIVGWFDENANPIVLPFTPVADIDSTYTLIYQVQEPGCMLFLEEMQMSFAFPRNLEILVPEINMCQGGMINTDTIISAEEGVSWLLGGSSPLDIVSQDGDHAIIKFDDPGQFQIFANGGTVDCPSTIFTSFTVNVEQQVEFDIRCLDDGFPIQFIWDNIACVDSFDIFLNGVYEKTQTNATFTPLGFPQGTDLDIEIVPHSSCLCEYQSVELTCNTGTCPPRETELTWRDTSFCLDLVPADIDNRIEFVIGSQGQNINIPIITDLGTTEYVFDITATNNCVYRDTAFITIFSLPAVSMEGFGSDCFDDPMGGVLVDLNPALFESEVIINNQVFLIDDLESTPFPEGNYDVVLTSIDGCEVTSFFAVPAPPSDFSIGINGNDSVDEGDGGQYFLSVSPDDVDWESIEWFIDDELICEDMFVCELESLGEGPDTLLINVVFSVRVECFKSDTFQVIINDIPEPPNYCDSIPLDTILCPPPPPPPDTLENIFIPNIFMPGDVLEGNWMIGSDAPFEVSRVQVFDRWGNLVFLEENFMVDGEYTLWDGSYGGVMCELGVYVYTIEYKDTEGDDQLIVGDLTLVR